VDRVARIGEMRNLENFSWKTWKEKSLRSPRTRWEDNIRVDLREIGCEGMDLILQAKYRGQLLALVNMVMNISVP